MRLEQFVVPALGRQRRARLRRRRELGRPRPVHWPSRASAGAAVRRGCPASARPGCRPARACSPATETAWRDRAPTGTPRWPGSRHRGRRRFQVVSVGEGEVDVRQALARGRQSCPAIAVQAGDPGIRHSARPAPRWNCPARSRCRPRARLAGGNRAARRSRTGRVRSSSNCTYWLADHVISLLFVVAGSGHKHTPPTHQRSPARGRAYFQIRLSANVGGSALRPPPPPCPCRACG